MQPLKDEKMMRGRSWTSLLQAVAVLAMASFLLFTTGCGPDRTLHPLTGKVTLGGKPYNRLIVYFRPIGKAVNEYNLGVGETDASGNLQLRSTAGDGLNRGKYRVAFSCVQVRGQIVDPEKKIDNDRGIEYDELVPEKFADAEQSPVEFEIKPGANVFEFDIPTK
jgi:hypothetical protein